MQGSVVFHDAISASYVQQRINVAGAPFLGGSDDYGGLWAQEAGFGKFFVHDFGSLHVDRSRRRLVVDPRYAEATPERCAGRNLPLFVVAEKL